MWFIRRVCFVLVFLGLVASAWLKPTPMAAQAPLTGDQAAPLLNPVSEGTRQDFEAGRISANSGAYLYETASYPGTAFHRRNSTVGYAYYGGGCTYLTAANGANEDNNALSTRLDLPDGAIIVGVEFQYRDTDTVNNSRLYLYRFDGAGGIASVALLNSSGNGGYGSSYTTNLNTTYDSFNYSYSLVWYSGAVGLNHALCGVRVKYAYPAPVSKPFTMPPANQPDALQGGSSGYSFTAASDFVAINDTITYSYSGAGCMIHNGGANLAAEVDAPDGSQLAGYRAFYYNTVSGAAMDVNLSSIDGSIASAVLLASTTTSSGYANEYFVPTTNEVFDELNKGYILYIRPGTSSSTRMCGVRTFYNTPAQVAQLPAYTNPVSLVSTDRDASGMLLTENAAKLNQVHNVDLSMPEELASPQLTMEYQFITPRSFVPRDSDQGMESSNNGCVAFGSDLELSYTFQLPPNSGLRGVRFYYRNPAGDSVLARYWAYNGYGWFTPIFSYSIPSSTDYTSSLVSYTGSHYDLSNGIVSHSLSVAALNASSTVDFCGARIWYTTGLRSLYIPVAFKN